MRRQREVALGPGCSCDDDTPDADATLEAAINTDKLVQDVKLRTDAATACAAGPGDKYKIGSDCFRHGHANEHNVYEFSQWVWDDMGSDMGVDWEALHDMADGSANSLTLAAGSTATFTWEETHDVWEFGRGRLQLVRFFGRHGNRWVVGRSVMTVDVTESVGRRSSTTVVGGRRHSLRRRPEDRDHLVR